MLKMMFSMNAPRRGAEKQGAKRRLLRASALLLAAVFASCLSACAAKAPAELEDLSFDTAYFTVLGQPAADVAAELDASAEWDNAYVDGEPRSKPQRREPALVEGDAYDYHISLNGSEAWAISFERKVNDSGKEGKTAAVQKVYDLLVSELGEPEEIAGAISVGQGLQDGLANQKWYTEWWVLDEAFEMASNPGLDIVLTCHLKVGYTSSSVEIVVEYALYQPSGLREIARFRT